MEVNMKQNIFLGLALLLFGLFSGCSDKKSAYEEEMMKQIARNKQLEKEQDAAYEKRKAALDVYLKK
jgi:hypothetical protein